MKTANFIRKVAVIFFVAEICILNCPMQAQTIQIDSVFTSDGEIFPFSPNDTIYGLSISGTVTLLSDTSLVRVILTDSSGQEWMVYEAYPMIVTDSAFDFEEECDETCYLTGLIPESLKIQLNYGQITITAVRADTVFKEDLEQLHQSSLENKELMKISMINSYLEHNKMLWRAAHTIFSEKTYQEKKLIFGDKYCLFGYDFYNGGIYCPYPIRVQAPIESNLVKDFDWRKRHGANNSEKNNFYYDEDPDRYEEEECQWQSWEMDEHGNGWMTAVKSQLVHYHNEYEVCRAHCRSTCYIYGSLAALEAILNLYYIRTDAGLDLSEQQVLDCGGDEISCDPGFIDDVSDYLEITGVIDEDHYPWEDHKNASCNSYNISQGAYHVTIGDQTAVNKSQVDVIKEAIITHGPLVAAVKYNNSGHAMALIGFGTIKLHDFYHNPGGSPIEVTDSLDPNIGKIFWIFKQSYSPGFGDGGYVFHLQDQFDPPHNILTELNKYLPPFEGVPGDFNDTRNCYDKDSDGYCFWGIGERQGCDNCEVCPEAEDLEDCDDSNPRIGPYASDYTDTPIAPEMEVSLYKQWLCNDIVENGDFFYIKNSCFIDDQILEFKINNDGNAQLNLSPVGDVVSLSGLDANEFNVNQQPSRKIKFNTESSFKIKYNGNLTETKTVVVNIGVFETDMPHYQFALILNGCQTYEGTDDYNGIVNWDDPYKVVQRDIKINPGCILTITGNVAFSEEADILIDRGGKLVLDGCKLTSTCSNLWNGIQVWGYSDKSQLDLVTPPGKVQVCNNALIENARIAIATIKSENGIEDYNYTGGIVWCKDSKFLNNIYGVRFYHYMNFNPNQVFHEISNISDIKNCIFETNGHLAEYNSNPLVFIRLDDVAGVNMLANQFINSSGETYDIGQKGNGIECYNATFFMTGICRNPTIPCDEWQQNYFFNLDYGVKVHGQGRENMAIAAMHANFNSNLRGMFISYMNNTQIYYNTFTVPEIDHTNEIRPYGLYMEYCGGYGIEENIFLNRENGPDGYIGMYINNSGEEPNEIYKNDFSNLEYGIVAYGQNRSETGEGLCLKCNNFNQCLNDIHVIPEKDPYDRWLQGRNQGIASSQGAGGSDTAPAGNTFTKLGDISEAFNYFNHEYCNNIMYYYHEENETPYKIEPFPYSPEPLVDPTEANLTTYHSKEEACPSNNGGGGINLTYERENKTNENDLFVIYNDSIETLVDGGDTYSLNFDVYTSTVEEAYQIRQQLLDESPFLSDTVLKSAIYKENVLPNAMVRDVLVANPQSAKSSEIIEKVNERVDPMPEEMMDEILEGMFIKGNLEVFQEKLATHKTEKYHSLHKLESYYKQDTLDFQGSQDSLVALWSAENDPEILYRQAFYYLYNKDSINCYNVLNSIPQLSDLSDKQEVELEGYYTLMEILWSLGPGLTNLDSIQTDQLMDIYLQRTEPGCLARNVLIANNIINYNEPIYLADELKSMPVTHKSTIKNIKKTSYLSVFPNPARDYIIVAYDLKEKQGPSSISISSIDGTPRLNQDLTGKVNQMVIPLKDLGSGVYFVQLFHNGTVIESVKFVLSN